MKKVLFILHLILGCLITSLLSAQNEHIQVSVLKTDSVIIIRWVPDNVKTWTDGLKYGYTIEKREETSFSDSTSIPVCSQPILPLDKNNKKWEDLKKMNPAAHIICQTLSPAYQNEMMFGLALKACDEDTALAKAYGLLYSEKNQSNINYTYTLRIHHSANNNVCGHSRKMITVKDFIAPEITTIRSKNKTVSLCFNVKDTRTLYSEYYIQRSSDSIHFANVNAKGLSFVQTQYEKDKTELCFTDTVDALNSKYWYRLYGKSWFGVNGNFSKVYAVETYPEISCIPEIDSAYAIDNKYVFISWKCNDTSAVNYFLIAKSDEAEGKYRLMKWCTKNNVGITDSLPEFTSYYKIGACNAHGDTVWSMPALVQLQDNEAPLLPEHFQGYADTAGIIHLSWDRSLSKDIKGYRIFRAYNPFNEFTEVNDSLICSLQFMDTVSLQTLNKKVYYKIAATDKVWNSSVMSMQICISLPDKIAPAPVSWRGYDFNDSSVTIQWNNSISDDLMCLEVIRISTIDSQCVYSQSLEVTSFQDLTSDQGTVKYYIILTDSSGNSSISEPLSVQYFPHQSVGIKNLKIKNDFEKRVIVMTWDRPKQEVNSYIIYRSVNNTPFRLYTTTSKKNFFIDKYVFPGNHYSYSIKAVYENGAESKPASAETDF